MAECVRSQEKTHLGPNRSLQQTSILLIRSQHLGWMGLRTALRQQRDVRIVGDVRDPGQAVSAVTELRPHVIFAPAQLGGTSIVPLLTQLRACCPTSKIIVLGDELDRDELMKRGQVGIATYLLWNGLTPMVIRHSLAAVLEAGLWVGSPAVLQRLVDLAGCQPSSNVPHLSANERAVLKALAEGLTQQQIASATHLSDRTVRRIVSTLEQKFQAPTAFVLGVKAARLGFIDTEETCGHNMKPAV